ncbi:gp53-like domain-containing protein [Limnohabitans sp.]|uniref:gp53-like domain-containing protein n=1 Tax=Limnohabitans sp. TaxID=1907725 RepID=UPI00286EBC88|nr:hypothetical protein [Limnohabitans sp.]
MSYAEGFNFNFERNLATDPLAKPIGRQKLNQILNDITDALGDAQTALTAVATTGAYVAGGTSFVATPAKALSTLTGARLSLLFGADGGAAPTINTSGLGAKSLKQYGATGAKVAAVIAANQLADIEYDGIDFVILDPLPASLASLGFAGAKATSGYQKLPGGLIIQWGVAAAASNSSGYADVTFPIAFPGAVLSVYGFYSASGTTAGGGCFCTAASSFATTTTCRIWTYSSSFSTPSGGNTPSYLAIGY